VILNLALWFALHVFFADVSRVEAGSLEFWFPDPSTLDWRVVLIAILGGLLLLWRHWSIPAVLAASAGLALLMGYSGL
jgi:chromate transporter